MAQPWSIRFPISAEAISDCARLRAASAVSIGGNVGELSPLDNSVGGVETPEGSPMLEEKLLAAREDGMDLSSFGNIGVEVDGWSD